MKKRGSFISQKFFLLAIGLFCILVGEFFLALMFSEFEFSIILLRAFLLGIFGFLLIFKGFFAKKMRAFFIFIGMEIILYSFVLQLQDAQFFEFRIKNFWPIFISLSGVSLLPAGYISAKKMKRKFVVPAVAMVLFGGFCSLFSFDVIKMSFSRFMLVSMPVVLLLAGAYLIILFFLNQRNSFSQNDQ